MLTSAICASVQRDALKSEYLRGCCRVLHSGLAPCFSQSHCGKLVSSMFSLILITLWVEHSTHISPHRKKYRSVCCKKCYLSILTDFEGGLSVSGMKMATVGELGLIYTTFCQR